MPTRLMLIRDSAPMPGVRVKIKGVEGDFRSNDDGMVEVPVESESFSVAVHDTQDWIVKTVRRTNPSSMVVVDLSNKEDSPRKRWDLTERYTFEKVLGRGGMGVVVQATDNVLKRPVAIKMLSDEFLENDEAQELFMTEGRAMATLSHPNLVVVHDVTKAGGRVLMVLEFVAGQNVERMLQERNSIPVAEALSITIQVLKALEYLHAQGVIHRDLKPGNFMINEAGTVKVIDFGLARSLEDLYDKGTRVRGTPAYMAPEQILGEQMSAATDIYQMGVSLWELLVGQLPYSGEQLYAHVHEDVPRVSDVDQTIDPELDEILWGCLQKDPTHRPSSTAALRAQLESVYYRIATDPNLETAATAHLVESDLVRREVQTDPNPPSRAPGLSSGTVQPDDANLGDDESSNKSALRWVVLVILLLIGGGVAAFASGVFDSAEAPAPVVAPEPVADVSQPPAPTTTTVDADPLADRLAAVGLARGTVDDGLSRSLDALADASTDSDQPARPKSAASKAKKPAPKEPEQAADTAPAQTEPAAAEVEPAEVVDEPAPFQPKTFAPVSAKKPVVEDKKTETKPAPKAEPKSKPVEKKKTEPEVPVSF